LEKRGIDPDLAQGLNIQFHKVIAIQINVKHKKTWVLHQNATLFEQFYDFAVSQKDIKIENLGLA
tara:strand:+ start:379 stop:573 length:195 start_codon:yes stop_codon:yes gene_type:complete